MARTATSIANGKDVSAQDVEAQIATLKSDISELTKVIAELGKSRSTEVAAQARQNADALVAKGNEVLASAKTTAQDAAQKTETAIKENPGTAVAIATGLGFLAGILATRR
ncbi:DUF883 family protein [Pseudoprimorskyibacter insulae]|uniref:DUF883 domain-containing protein n=1 Tax=Pseudoprimorskyibacter insulae TaxID=1695997 RepID=A0A2R8AUA4_9RHOB|nr:DUF883 family protein [Pseudoprimorskyibacter insulae]SPF79560.1 hypothetical protein PRI8871_01356 [Pseudoprimorskyibacter insulae]